MAIRFMVAGMFVQVLVENHQRGSPTFEVTVPDLLLPLLFSLVVYYPIWSVAASAPTPLFSFYAAFLNGYFWRNVLAAARPLGINERKADSDADPERKRSQDDAA